MIIEFIFKRAEWLKWILQVKTMPDAAPRIYAIHCEIDSDKSKTIQFVCKWIDESIFQT